MSILIHKPKTRKSHHNNTGTFENREFFPHCPHPVALPFVNTPIGGAEFGPRGTHPLELHWAWHARDRHRARLRAAKRESSLEHLRPSTKHILNFATCYPTIYHKIY